MDKTDPTSDVDLLVDVVTQMGEEAARLKGISEQMQFEKNSKDPAQSLKSLTNLLGQLSGGDGKLFDLSSKLQEVSNKFQLLSESEKAEFEQRARDQLGPRMEQIKQITNTLIKDAGSKQHDLLQPYDYKTILICVAIVLTIFAFFGYKLYKSLKDKELRKEEKRKLKQLKKRK